MEGNFRNLGFDENEVEIMEDAYNAIQKADKWAFMSNDYAVFKDNHCPDVQAIRTHMKTLHNHSGESYEWVMRIMMEIARNGWVYFVNSAIKNNIVMAPGDFGKLGYDSNDIAMLDDGYKAVTAAELWGFLRNNEFRSFQLNSLPEIKRIDTRMKYDGHSGSSYGWTMRAMESIAKDGWETFCLRRLKRMRMNAW